MNTGIKMSKKIQKTDSISTNPFGPQLGHSKPVEAKGKIIKLIHYDCMNTDDVDGMDDDIPEEDEIYVKENLLNKKNDEPMTEPDDDLSIVNINVSKLLSSEGGENSNSKNSLTFHNNSPDSKKKNSLASNSKISISKTSKEYTGGNNTINTINTLSNKTQTSNSNPATQKKSVTDTKKSIITKRKILYEKLKCKEKAMKDDKEGSPDEDELADLVDINYENCSSKVKITHITNIILNGKNIGPKSFEMKSIKTGSGSDCMMRDMKSLALITQKALSTNSKQNPVDSIDDERRNFINFRNIISKKELFIDDNSDMPLEAKREKEGNINNTSMGGDVQSNSFTFTNRNDVPRTENKQKNHIINIININNNYNIGSISMTKEHEGSSNFKKHYLKKPSACLTATEPCQTPIDSMKSNTSSKSQAMKRPIPQNSSGNKLIKDIISSCKNDKTKPKDKFIKFGK